MFVKTILPQWNDVLLYEMWIEIVKRVCAIVKSLTQDGPEGLVQYRKFESLSFQNLHSSVQTDHSCHTVPFQKKLD